MEHIDRIADRELHRSLGRAGAVVVEGAKAVGKTVTASRAAASAVQLDTDAVAAELAQIDPGRLLAGKTPRLIDEWQIVPTVWNHVRRAVDKRGDPGQFILTGSALDADEASRHSGAGRFARLRMRPLSSSEAGASSDEVALSQLFDAATPGGDAVELDLETLAQRLVRGGWPGTQRLSVEDAGRFCVDYLDQIARVDIAALDGKRRDPQGIRATMSSLARNTSREVSAVKLAADIGGAEGSIARQTVSAYLDSLSRTFTIEDQPAWSPSLKSRSSVRSAPRRHFVDPSLAIAAVGAGVDRILNDPSLLGLLFESMVIRDLRVYSQPLGGRVFHYRDNTGLEVDAIVETTQHGWAAIEVKLNPSRIDTAAKALLKLADRVNPKPTGPPRFLAVITAGGFPHRRADGVLVVPAFSLAP